MKMIAVKLLPLLQVLVVLCSPTYSYPTVLGTKRYGRLQRSHPALPSSYLRAQSYPMNYYEMYPYSQTYPEEYYYEPMSYPVYYPRTSKYEVYQAVLPYYYDRPLMQRGFAPGYYGYDDAADPMVDIEEEMLHDAERRQREDAQPIGQETYFEDDGSAPNEENYYNDVNAAFLNNLILSQMYKDSLDKSANYNFDDSVYNDDVYGKIDAFQPNGGSVANINSKFYDANDDDDELELKSLVKSKPTQVKPDDRWSWFQKGSNKKNDYYEADLSERKRSIDGRLQWFTDRADRKPTMQPTVLPSTSSTTATATSAFTSKKTHRGQKEEVLPRPAKTVKHLPAVVNNVYKKDRPRQPSVYDTIKHMLDMEKSLENGDAVKPPMRKRIISSEDSLTRQLSVLKKHD